MTAEVNIPDEAYEAGERAVIAYDHVTKSDAYDIASDVLRAAAPLIVAADYEQFAAELRGTLHNLPEYTHGSLAWTVMNAIDQHIEDLRGESR